MTESPLVSVVMCSYNGRSFLEDAVADIRNQSYKNWELIISDDASSDGTREWLHGLEHDDRVRVFLQDRNLGYVRNKNFALRQCRGKYITQHDQDDRCDKNRLTLQVEALTRTGLEIAACGYERIDPLGYSLRTVSSVEECVLREMPADGYPFWFPALMFSGRVLAETGFFSEYFAGAYGDDLYWTVVANEKFPIVCLPDVLYFYKDSPSSITSLLDNPRKLVVGRVLQALIEQRKLRGTDWLEQRDFSSLQEMEADLLANERFLSQKYQIYAARSIDQGRLLDSISLLWNAYRLTPFRTAILSTLFYLIRASFGNFRSDRTKQKK